MRADCPKTKPSAIVNNGTLPSQRKILGPLGNLTKLAEEEGLGSPAVIFVGNAVGLAGTVDWFEHRPLFGRRIVVTRPVGQSVRLKKLLENKGAEVLELPLIKILPVDDRKLVAEVFAGLATYGWIVFTSANGAREFFNLFFKAFGDIRSFGPMRVACVGEATASVVRGFNLEVELIPPVSTAEDLGQALVATESLDSENVLVVTGNRNRDVLVNLLESVGHAIVDTLSVYSTDYSGVSEAGNLRDFREKGCHCLQQFIRRSFLCGARGGFGFGKGCPCSHSLQFWGPDIRDPQRKRAVRWLGGGDAKHGLDGRFSRRQIWPEFVMIAVPEVKVCGITRLEDGQNAISLGASFLGFILFEGSPMH